MPSHPTGPAADARSLRPGGLLPIGRARLAGRGGESGLLRSLLERASVGQTELALVDGEPGVGKTRLLAELGAEAAAAGWRVLEGGAYEGQGFSPYQPLVEALGRYVDEVGVPAARRQLGEPAARVSQLLPALRRSRAPPGPDDRPALFEAWAQLLRRLAAEQPLLLLLDDLHWADPACLDLLLYVRRRVRDARLLILAAYREGEVGSDDAFQHALVELNRLRLATPLHLDRLDRAATASLLDGLLGSPIAPRLAGLVYRESEGNPFFVEEIVRGLVERDRLVNRMGAWDLADEAAGALPATTELREAIRDRLRRLSPGALGFLRAAAVLGRNVALGDLAALADAAAELVAESLGEAARRQLVIPRGGDAYRFSHDKVRETLYDDLDPVQRGRLHARAVELIEVRGDPADAAQIAHHCLRGPEPQRARPFLTAAGDQAMAAHAYANAAGYYQRAVDLVRSDDRADLPGALLRLAGALVSAGRYGDALAALHAALDAATGPTLRGQIHEQIGAVHLAREEADLAEGALRRSLDLTGDGDEPRRARVLLRLGQLYVSVTGQLEDGSRVLREALAIAVRRGEAGLEAEVVTQLGQLEMHRGDFATGRVRFEQALAIADRLADLRSTDLASNGLARGYYWTAAFHDLRAIAGRELAVARRSGDPQRLGWPTFWLGQAAIQLADWREAEARADALVRLGEQLGARRFLAQGHELRGVIANLRGDHQRACAALGEAVTQFRAIGAGALVYYLGPYCLALIDADRGGEATVALDELLDLARGFPRGTSPRTQAHNVAALALLRLGRRGEALGLYDELLPAERQLHWHLVSRTLARLAIADGRWSRAPHHLALAREIATRGGGRVEMVQVVLAQAELAGQRGEPREAAELARQGRQLAASCGLALASAATDPTAARAPARLSPREVEVLRLVAEGRTNRAIAAALGITEKTATNHLTHIFDKIGVDNRAGATAYAVRNGLV